MSSALSGLPRGARPGRLLVVALAAVTARVLHSTFCSGFSTHSAGHPTGRPRAALDLSPEAAAALDVVETPEGGVRQLPAVGTPPWKWRRALLSRVASLNRGASATALDDRKVQKLGEKLRMAALQDEAFSMSFPEAFAELDGRWRLLYSSGFVRNSSARLGGMRVGPSIDSSVLEVGDVFQVFQTQDLAADTQVTLRPPRWLRDTGLLEALPFGSGNPDTVVTLTQKIHVAAPDVIRFAFNEGSVKSMLLERLGAVQFPLALWGLPADAASEGPFTDNMTTTYCDGDMRIGIGGRFGEFRVFQRA